MIHGPPARRRDSRDIRGGAAAMRWRLGVVLTILSSVAAGCSQEPAKPLSPPPPVVTVSRAVGKVVADYEEFTGTTAAVYTVEIRARVTGYLEKIYFKDGVEVGEGDKLFQIDPRPYMAELERTKAALVQAEARAARLAADFRREESLYAKKMASREEYDKVVGDRAEADAAVGIARAELDQARLNMEFTEVKAPISGLISRRQVDQGNLVRADETMLTTIVSLDPMHLYFDVDERTLLRLRRLIREGKIKSRQEAEIKIQAGLADEVDFPHTGVINFSENRLDASTGTLRVRAVLQNPRPRVLSPGLFMRIRLPVGDPHKSILVPEQALTPDQGKKIVYVVNSKDEVVYRQVDLGPLYGGLRAINEGVSEGERIVISGLQRIRPGMTVKVQSLDRDEAKRSAAVDEPQGDRSRVGLASDDAAGAKRDHDRKEQKQATAAR